MAAEPRRLRCQDLIRRLARFGVVVARQRGSHIILLKPSTPGGTKGRTYPVGCHRPTVEVSIPVIRAVLRAFEIPEAAFWAEE